MNVHEYQAKELLRHYGVPVPAGAVAGKPEQVPVLAEKLGGRVVIKAQVHAGGRGKAGGVKLASNPEEALAHARGILGMRLVTPQTGAEGRLVRKVLVEAAVSIQKEFYLAALVDRESARPVIIACREGGMEIEAVAHSAPEKIAREVVDPLAGLQPFQARHVAAALGLEGEAAKAVFPLLTGLYRLLIEKDASQVEINPLVITAAGQLLAADAKINFDDNALFRHPDIARLRDLHEEQPLEVEASKYHLNYIRLHGEIGCMVNGAGLAMATMDVIQHCGGSPANFLDVGGGANAETVEQAFRIILKDKNVRAILINIFGGIVRCDRVASGVAEAARKVRVKLPVVVRLAGTNAEEGRKILDESGLSFLTAASLAEAAHKAVEAVKSL